MVCFLYVVTKYSLSHQLSAYKELDTETESEMNVNQIFNNDETTTNSFQNNSAVKSMSSDPSELNREFKQMLEKIRLSLLTDDKTDSLIFRQFLSNKNAKSSLVKNEVTYDLVSSSSLNENTVS